MVKGWRRFLPVVGVVVIGLLGATYYFYPTISDTLIPGKDLNVILISVDAARADRFLFNGTGTGLTPNIDKLTRTGVVFKRAYCYSAGTPPSMGAIFTSRFPYWPPEPPGGGPRGALEHVYGFTRFFDSIDALRPGIPNKLETLPTIFKRHGYTTIGITSNPHLTREFRFDRGFDFFEEFSTLEQPFSPQALYASAEDVRRKLDVYLSEFRDEKFFAWIHFMDMHWPLTGHGPWREKARSRRIQVLHRPVSEWTQYAKEFMTLFGTHTLPNWKPTEEGLLKARDAYTLAYDAQLLRIDEQIGEIVNALRENDLWEKTLIIIVNDHGDEFMEHRDFIHTGQLYEEIVRGVWIMHNPKLFPSPVTVDVPVSLADLMPTLLQLLRLGEDSRSFDGVSRVSLLEAGNEQNSENAFVFGLFDQRAYAIEGDYKLIVTNHLGKQARGATRRPPSVSFELYNLREDPGEQENLAKQFPQVVDRLHVKLKHAFLKKGIRFWEHSPSKEVSKETRERLKSLGYVQ